MIRVILVAVMMLVAIRCWAESYPEGMVILETQKKGETQLVAGDAGQMNKPEETASTFKVVIAWAALDRGLIREVKAPLEGAEGADLRQALQKSLNPPFAILAEKLGGKVLASYAERSGLIEGKIAQDWMKAGSQEAVHGADLQTTLRREHAVAVGWMRGEAPWNSPAGKKLEEALLWEKEEMAIFCPKTLGGVRAKTGSYGGVLWMTGYGEGKAVTVFMRGAVERRPEVIRAFLSRF